MKYIITQYVTYSGEIEADSEDAARAKWLEILDSGTLDARVEIESSDIEIEKQ